MTLLRPRRHTSNAERATACVACAYPISHRHHLYPVALHGENDKTIQLCPNCHELYHMIYDTHQSSNPRAAALLDVWLARFGADDGRYLLLCDYFSGIYIFQEDR